jgi:hypothetical protein
MNCRFPRVIGAMTLRLGPRRVALRQSSPFLRQPLLIRQPSTLVRSVNLSDGTGEFENCHIPGGHPKEWN